MGKTTHNSLSRDSKFKKNWFSSIIRFIIFMAIWLILSGAFDWLHISMGALCCILVEIMVGRPLALGFHPGAWPAVLRFVFMYLPWLVTQVLTSNLHVLYIVMHPNLKTQINPQVVKFQTKIKSEIGRYILANSITLTPGTTTIYASPYGEFTVHALNDDFAKDLPGKMETMIIKVLGE